MAWSFLLDNSEEFPEYSRFWPFFEEHGDLLLNGIQQMRMLKA
jgi:hypothetical protein